MILTDYLLWWMERGVAPTTAADATSNADSPYKAAPSKRPIRKP